MSQKISGVLSLGFFFLVAETFPAQAQFSDGGPRKFVRTAQAGCGNLCWNSWDTGDMQGLREVVATGGKQ